MTIPATSEQKARRERHLPVFHAACLCGSVRYKVRVDARATTPCICARCRGQGLKVAYADEADFTLMTGADDLTENLKDARTPHHFFCARCGEAVFGRTANGYSVNAACLPRGSLAAIGLRERHSIKKR